MQGYNYALMVDDNLIEKRTFLSKLAPEQQRRFCRGYAQLHEISETGLELIEIPEQLCASNYICDLRVLVDNLATSDWHRLKKKHKKILRAALLDLNVIERAISDD